MMTRSPQKSGPGGFTLMEMLIALALFSVVLIAILTFFDASNRLARTQVALAEMQSSQRIGQQEMVHMVGMAGIGGLPEGLTPAVAAANPGVGGVFPSGLALSVRNNVAADSHVGDDDSPLVITGSDVLTLRGVFSTEVLMIEPMQSLVLDGNGDTTLTVQEYVDLGVSQSLDDLRAELSKGREEALIVYDRYNPGAYAVLQYDPAASSLGSPGDPSMTIGLTLSSSAAYADEYGTLTLGTTLLAGSGGVTWDLTGSGITIQLPKNVGAIGLLEEYRFYVREEHEVPGDDTSRLKPVLTQARFFPHSDDAYPDGTWTHIESAIDLAENIIDLQVTLGVDQGPNDGGVVDIGAAADDDEVLFNYPGDDDGLGSPSTSPWADPASKLFFTRVTTVAQSFRPDPKFPGVILGAVEDHDYSALPVSVFNSATYTPFRKRMLQTIVEMRNLP